MLTGWKGGQWGEIMRVPCGEPSDSGNKGISGTVINKKDNSTPQAPGYSSPGLIFSFESER